MIQKLKDFSLLLQKDKKVQFLTACAVLMVLFFVFSSPAKRRGPRPVEEEQKGTTFFGEAEDDIVRAFRSDLDSTKGEVRRIHERIDEQDRKFDEFQNSSAGILKKILERMSEIEAGGRSVNGLYDPNAPVDVSNAPDPSLDGANGDAAADAQAITSFGDLKNEPAPPTQPEPKRVAFVGPGDSVRIKLLAGVNAPTDGTPYPVVFQLMSDVFGPDSSQLPLGEARIVAAAQGSLTDSRALFRLTSMNVRLPNGRRKVLPVDGWVVGEDGIRGMEGILIDPIGKAIGGAGFAGFLQGVGEGVAASNVNTTNSVYGPASVVSGSVNEFALGKGVSGAANVYSRLIEERVNALVPVVQVLSGREATAVFSRAITVDDLYEALDTEDGGAVSGLD